MERPKVKVKVRTNDFARDSEERVRANQEFMSSRAHGDRLRVAAADWKIQRRGLHPIKIPMTTGRREDEILRGIGAMKDMAADALIKCLC